MNFNNLLCEKQGSVFVARLNRPDKMNSLTNELLAELDRLISLVAEDSEVRALVIAAEGKNFCVGADISAVRNVGTTVEWQQFFRKIHGTMNKLENLPKPTIAAIQGYALGGGCEMTLACDLRVAAENAFLGLTEIKLGTLPGAGGTQRLPRIVGAGKALELLYLGDPVSAQEARSIGLVNKVVPAGEVLESAVALAGKLASRPPIALSSAKMLVRKGSEMPLDAALDLEIQTVSLLASTEDQKEGMAAFMEKRPPQFKGR